MPIPKPSGNEEDYISKCISAIADEYTEDGQAYAVCKSTWDNSKMGAETEEEKENAQQGGVVAAGFARTKFEYKPMFKEKLQDYMARCMSDVQVRERKPSRNVRAFFCYSEYQNRYAANIGKNWK
jgi:hypothetical protein